MTDEDIRERRRQLDAAQTPEERTVIERVWQEKSLICQAHTAERVKELVQKSATKADIEGIGSRISALHSCPKFKDDKLGWLRQNWLWVMAFLYMLQSMLGVNVVDLVNKIIERMFG